MASIVTLGSMEELENTLIAPLGLTHLKIHDVAVQSDTNKLFFQGRIKSICGLVKHAKAPMFYRKVLIEEDDTPDQMHIILTVEEKSTEQLRFLKEDTISSGDLLVVANVSIELDPFYPSQSGAHLYQAIVNLSSPDCKVWLVKASPDSSCKRSKHPEKVSAASTAVNSTAVNPTVVNSIVANPTVVNPTAVNPTVVNSIVANPTVVNPIAVNPTVVNSIVANPTVVNRTVTKPKSQKKEPYAYVKIDKLVASTTVNVFGVVKFVKDPCKTRGLDFSMVLTIVDELTNTLNDKLKCILFGTASKLPSAKPGDIIRFHRLKIATFKNEFQGQNGPGFSWIVFDGSKDGPLSPTGTSHENNTITEEDQERVRQLRLWAASETGGMSPEGHAACSLTDVTVGQYFDLICQVVGTCVVIEGESFLLKVWDGTRVKLKLYEQDMAPDDICSRLLIDKPFSERVKHFLVDVWVFDEHFGSAAAVKPLDFIRLHNLHALKHKPRPEEEAVSPGSVSVELCLHRGFGYGRRLTILDPASKEVNDLQQVMKRELAAAAIDDSADSIDQLWGAAHDVYSTGTTNILISNENTECNSISDDFEAFCTPPSQPQPAHDQPSHQFNGGASTSVDDVGSGAGMGQERHAVGGGSKESAQKRSMSVSGEIEVKRIRLDKSTGLESDAVPSEKEKVSGSENDVAVPVENNVSHSENTVTQPESETLFSSGNDVALNGHAASAEIEAGPAVLLQSPASLGFTRNRCMLNTATVMTGHHHIKATGVIDIQRHTPPSKFRFQGFAINYRPQSETVCGFLRLYCNRCGYLSSVPCSSAGDRLESSELSENIRVPKLKSTEDDIKFYFCPNCNGDLEYIYMLEFILNDGTGWISAGLWREEANHFFGCTPVDLLRNPNRYDEIVKKLNQMCFSQCAASDLSSSEPHKMECCLMSYQTSSGITYQIFDTTFAVDS